MFCQVWRRVGGPGGTGHYDVDPDRWDPIIQFADLALPRPPPMQYCPITKEEWTKALKSKRKKAATGPDGVSRQDLLNLPDQATEALLELFAGIEAGNQWPRQLVLGDRSGIGQNSVSIPNKALPTNNYTPNCL